MNIYIARYIGYCNIAISQYEDKVKEYVKDIRRLKKGDYKIFQVDVSDRELVAIEDRPEYISTKYGLSYTNIDWYIMDIDFGWYVNDLVITRDTLKETIINMSKVLSKGGEDSLQESLEEIEILLKKVDIPGKERDEVEGQFCKRHSLNHMNILTYLAYTREYETGYNQQVILSDLSGFDNLRKI